MANNTASLIAVAGPNKGDTLSVGQGSCRLVGRHLSESETTLMDRDGNRRRTVERGDVHVLHPSWGFPAECPGPPA